MHLIYLDESGQTGTNLNDKEQPIFVLAALIVPEEVWLDLEKDLIKVVEKYFPAPRPDKFEIHAQDIRNGIRFFRDYSVSHRLDFIDACLRLAHKHELKLIYRAIVKRRFLNWVRSTLGTGVDLNPHIAAFSLIAHVVNKYLASLPGYQLGMFISDENREIISDVDKAVFLLRVTDGALKLDHIIEKGFFIDSSKSLVLQLCDLCTYYVKKKEEKREKLPIKSMDEQGITLIEPLIYRGDEALQDTLEWLVNQNK